VTFSEAVKNVASNNFTVTTTGAVGTTIGTPTSNAPGTVWTVPVSVSGNGTVQLKLGANQSALTDLAGNPIPTTTTTGDIITVQQTPPSVSSIVLGSPSPTKATSLSWTVTFSQSVVGVAANNFSLVTSAGVSGTIGTVTGSGTTWTVPVTVPANLNGTIGLNLSANQANIKDVANNQLAGNTIVGPAYTLDTTAPTVTITIDAANPSPTGAYNLKYDVHFSEAVSGVAANNFAFSGSPTGMGLSFVSLTPGAGPAQDYVVTINEAAPVAGTVSFSLSANQANIKDAALNQLAATATNAPSLVVQGNGRP
jgi:hypothetical protein